MDELIAEVTAGRGVAVVAPTLRAGRWWLDRFAEALKGDAAVTLRRTNGQERIDHTSGGWVRFGSVASAMWRGLRADTLYLDVEPTERELAALMPMLASATTPRLIRASQ